MNLNWGAIVHRVNGDVAGQVKTFAQLSIGELCQGVGDLDFREVGGMWQDKLQNEMGCSHCSIVDMDGLVDAIQSWRLGSNGCFFRFQDDMYTAFGRYTVLGTHQSFDSTGMPVFLFFRWCLGCVLWSGKNIGYSKSFTPKVENQQLAFEPLGVALNESWISLSFTYILNSGKACSKLPCWKNPRDIWLCWDSRATTFCFRTGTTWLFRLICHTRLSFSMRLTPWRSLSQLKHYVMTCYDSSVLLVATSWSCLPLFFDGFCLLSPSIECRASLLAMSKAWCTSGFETDHGGRFPSMGVPP